MQWWLHKHWSGSLAAKADAHQQTLATDFLRPAWSCCPANGCCTSSSIATALYGTALHGHVVIPLSMRMLTSPASGHMPLAETSLAAQQSTVSAAPKYFSKTLMVATDNSLTQACACEA